MAETANTFEVKVITPERVFYEGVASMIEFTTTEGDIGVYAHHIPLTTVLAPGVETITESEENKKVAGVYSGFAAIWLVPKPPRGVQGIASRQKRTIWISCVRKRHCGKHWCGKRWREGRNRTKWLAADRSFRGSAKGRLVMSLSIIGLDSAMATAEELKKELKSLEAEEEHIKRQLQNINDKKQAILKKLSAFTDERYEEDMLHMFYEQRRHGGQ